VASLPPYQLGMSLGVLVGLRLALDALTLERIHQHQLADDPDPRVSAACRAYADKVLVAVMRVVASRFLTDT
jgi:hypothetical protein